MLFVKYVSDVWHDHYEQYKAQFGDDVERVRRRIKYERFVLQQQKKGLIQRLLTGRVRVGAAGARRRGMMPRPIGDSVHQYENHRCPIHPKGELDY